MKTFKTLQDDALRWIDEVENTDVLRSNIKQAIAGAQAAILTERNWTFMRWPSTVSVTLDGSQYVALHPLFYRLVRIENTTLDIPLIEVTDQTRRTRFHDTKEFVELRGRWSVKAQPSTPDTLVVTSTSASDLANMRLTLRGVNADGDPIEEEISTETAGSLSFAQILQVTKTGSSEWLGTLTLATAGGQELLKLNAGEYGRSYQTLYFRDTPVAGHAVSYDFMRQPNRLEHDNDIPDIPPPFEDILTYRGLIDLSTYTEVETPSLKIWQSRYNELLTALITTYGEPHSFDQLGNFTTYIPTD